MPSRRRVCVCAALSLIGPLGASDAGELLHPLFSDHVVLQREAPIRVWGTATAGERVVVALADSRAEALADRNGQWNLLLAAKGAGGPYTLTATSSSGVSERVDDVMVGDVWLCSGQSNMVLQVHRALDSRAEIANANSDSVRLLTVPLTSSPVPQSQFAGPIEWRRVTSESIAEYSAACWYFARELQKTVNVPMGLITAAWGGSKIESWMSAAALRAMGGYEQGLDILATSVADPWLASAQWGAVWEQWWRQQPTHGAKPWSVKATGEWRRAPAELGPWEQWGDARLSSYNGMVWYRTTVTLSAAQATQAATLSLGQVDEVDQTWVNGRPIGARMASRLSPRERAAPIVGTGSNRTYRLPRGALTSADNVIVINVLDTYASGGLRGPASARFLRLDDGTNIPLDAEWLYQLPPDKIGTPPRAPWENVAGLGVIFNGMIAPLTSFGVRGVVWYQGESNTEAPSEYGRLLQGFMSDWRARFGKPLPFLVVQLANFGAPPTRSTASGWAELREQQRRTVEQDPHAGLAIAIDLGERDDIHPANKQELGRRLARVARHVVFNEPLPPSGPRVRSARKEGERIIVAFADVTDSLVTYSARRPIGFELCGADQASCRFVDADLMGDRVSIDASASPDATRVRYCWADSPVCTLYDQLRLPAGPFEIEVQR